MIALIIAAYVSPTRWPSGFDYVEVSKVHAYDFRLCSRHFTIGYPRNCIPGSPIEGSQMLFVAVGAGRELRVNSIGSLAGKVSIKSPHDALEFARLRTSRRTYYLLADGLQGEICDRNRLDL